MKVPVNSIKISQNRRTVDIKVVKNIAESIKQVGLLTPIIVSTDNFLIAGAHRLQAVILLGWPEIDASVIDLQGLKAELAEIDENLMRHELHYIERGEQLKRRKEIYEELYPETKKGAVNQYTKLLKTESADSKLSFVTDTADKTGKSETTIKEEIRIAKNLTENARKAIKKADIPKTEALKLVKMDIKKQDAIAEKIIKGEVKKVSDAIREIKREEVIESLENIATKEVKSLQGLYDCIILDPPWNMSKIERDERPNQVEFDYPTMNEEELEQLKIPMAESCHLWVWTTQKFLPMAMRLLDKWGLKYVCTFVWHKNGGPQPFGLPQYNCEFVLYARKGTPQFIDTKAFNTCFNAKRGSHSEKPEEFYSIVRRVTAGRRLDMFSRRAIEGFDAWGQEAVE